MNEKEGGKTLMFDEQRREAHNQRSNTLTTMICPQIYHYKDFKVKKKKYEKTIKEEILFHNRE